MTDGQYRAIVAYLNYWTSGHWGIEEAINDIGITESKDEVIEQLAKAGHHYDEETGRLKYIYDNKEDD